MQLSAISAKNYENSATKFFPPSEKKSAKLAKNGGRIRHMVTLFKNLVRVFFLKRNVMMHLIRVFFLKRNVMMHLMY